MARRVYFQLFIAQNILFLSNFAQNSQKECIKEISQLHKTFFPVAQSAAPGGTSNPKPAICDHCCCDDLNYDTVSCQYLYGDDFIKSNEILKQNGLQKGFNRFYFENMFQRYVYKAWKMGPVRTFGPVRPCMVTYSKMCFFTGRLRRESGGSQLFHPKATTSLMALHPKEWHMRCSSIVGCSGLGVTGTRKMGSVQILGPVRPFVVTY